MNKATGRRILSIKYNEREENRTGENRCGLIQILKHFYNLLLKGHIKKGFFPLKGKIVPVNKEFVVTTKHIES